MEFFDKSLGDIHESVETSKSKNRWRRLATFFGPAYLVSVGYMDPGNWATDLAGGSQFGYKLIWVLLMCNIMAVILQSLSARLGIVRGRDLAQCNREVYPKYINFALYILAEISIAACDLAEVLGMAIGLNLLLGIPLIWAVIITALDTILLLYLQRLGVRKMEAFIIALVLVIGGCFLIEIIMAKPDMGNLARGFIPSIPNSTALYISIGIIGATVMPHNLYLHSALVQTRKISKAPSSIRKAIKINTLDSAIALNAAFFVNAGILILASAVFFTTGHQQVTALKEAHQLLTPLLGSEWGSHLFAIALIAAGQSSTLTGTLAGQIIMEGHLRLRINPWVRRLITRLLAIIPAVIVIILMGESMVDSMLVFSQVILSMQLAFAVIPLIHFVSDKSSMGVFAINNFTKVITWLISLVILFLNIKLVYETALEWMSGVGYPWVKILIVLVEIGLFILLAITFAYPIRKRKKKHALSIHKEIDFDKLELGDKKRFSRIALALDYSENDIKVIQYALQLGEKNTNYTLIHVIESPSSKLIGKETRDYETREDYKTLMKYKAFFEKHHHDNVKAILGYRNRIKEISRITEDARADLLIVGSHGHTGFKDIILGETVNKLRHIIKAPVFIAK